MAPRTVWIEAQVLEERESALIVILRDGFGNARAIVGKESVREQAASEANGFIMLSPKC